MSEIIIFFVECFIVNVEGIGEIEYYVVGGKELWCQIVIYFVCGGEKYYVYVSVEFVDIGYWLQWYIDNVFELWMQVGN